MKQIRQACQAGTGCGACVQQIRQMLDTAAPRHEHSAGGSGTGDAAT